MTLEDIIALLDDIYDETPIGERADQLRRASDSLTILNDKLGQIIGILENI